MTVYADLYHLNEDQRIEMIGRQAIDQRLRVGFFVDDEAKADRYIDKLRDRFPALEIVYRGKGPGDSVFVKVAAKA